MIQKQNSPLLTAGTFSVFNDHISSKINLTLKVPITTAADDNHKNFFFVFCRENKT